MNSKQQRFLTAAIIVLVVIIAGVVIWKYRPANNANLPEGTFWVCSNPQCGNEFAWSVKQFSDFKEKNPGSPVLCPKCGKEAVGADRCPFCKRCFPKGQRGDKVCPHCGKTIPASSQPGPAGA